MSKGILFAAVLVLIISFSYFIYINSRQVTNYTPGRWPEADIAINQAKHFYNLSKEAGVDFSNGPCLSNALMPGWVADVAHNPRELIDDDILNQCSSYINGTAEHFVELDLEGNLIRVK